MHGSLPVLKSQEATGRGSSPRAYTYQVPDPAIFLSHPLREVQALAGTDLLRVTDCPAAQAADCLG